jgi:O-acetylserine/cysteine efflux transporter
MPIRDMFLAVLVAAVWGANFVSAKYGMAHFPPLLLSGLRFLLVAAMLLPFVPRPKGEQLWRLVLLAFVLGVLHLSLLFAGLFHGLTIASSAIISQMGVPFSCLLGALFLSDKLGWYRTLGMVVAFVGIAIVAGSPNILEHPLGFGIAVASAFAWAVANLIMKQLKQMHIFKIVGWFSLFAAPQLLLLSLVFESNQIELVRTATVPAILSILYTAIGSTVVGYGLWSYLIRTHPVTQVTPFSLLVPVFGISFGQLFFSEPLSHQTLIGGAIAILGVAVIVVRRPKILTMGKGS